LSRQTDDPTIRAVSTQLMPLGPGTRLGPYEIVSAIGAGGMGEVYRATDTNLRRQVAIKVLPDAFAQDQFSSFTSPEGHWARALECLRRPRQ
jgi:serine/threonine protein kinase